MEKPEGAKTAGRAVTLQPLPCWAEVGVESRDRQAGCLRREKKRAWEETGRRIDDGRPPLVCQKNRIRDQLVSCQLDRAASLGRGQADWHGHWLEESVTGCHPMSNCLGRE